jgi:CDP-glucose 4,6-dehydratase
VEGLGVSGTELDGIFRDRVVFVTGHTGFKGSWLTLWLHRMGAKITGYSLKPSTSPNNFDVSGIRELLTAHHEADLRDRETLHSALKAAAPQVIFHLAAQPLVREGYLCPHETFEVNVMGTVVLLDLIRTLERPCVVVVVTSDKCYENREQIWGYRECDALGGRDPYSASKGAAELVAAAYRQSFFDSARLAEHGVKLATVRAGNVIGGGDWSKDRIVSDMVASLRAQKPVPVRNPGAVRPWQHVLEPLGGYLSLAARMLQSDDPRWCSAWNFGPLSSDEVSVRTLVELFCQAWGDGTWADMSAAGAPHEAAVLRLNIDKSFHELGWRPKWRLFQAVQRTASWYKTYAEGRHKEMQRVSSEDIAAYETPSE